MYTNTEEIVLNGVVYFGSGSYYGLDIWES